jgi:gp16 family phage-associated protein
MKQLKTPEQVKAEFDAKGLSFSEWAAKNGVPLPAVYRVINGLSAGKRGSSHRAAVLLGIKAGSAEPFGSN